MLDSPDHDRTLRLYVLERNVHHLSALLAAERDPLKGGVLRSLLESARQELHAFKSTRRADD
jgi:hypothetical protein